jgi:DNA-binding MarR family transcriptional regulator
VNIPDVAHPDYLSYRVKRLHMLVAQRIEDNLKPFGVARSQWQVLRRVSLAGELSQKDLQHAMQIESATLTGIVDVLVTKGWLERLESPDDKRCRVLRLTGAGAELCARIPDPYAAVEMRMLSGVPAEDQARVLGALETMIRNLEDRS